MGFGVCLEWDKPFFNKNKMRKKLFLLIIKENVNPITDALQSVLQLSGVTYDRKDGSTKHEAGLIAEDVYNVLPNLVKLDDAGKPLGINYTKLTAYLIESVKSLTNEIAELKKSK